MQPKTSTTYEANNDSYLLTFFAMHAVMPLEHPRGFAFARPFNILKRHSGWV
jgi:hypothetical protein